MFDWCQGLFNPIVLHMLFLFRLPQGSSTRWSYVWLMPRGSSTWWSYTCCFCFDCPVALQPSGLMFDWCLEALQLDGLTHVVFVSIAPWLFNLVVLCLTDALRLFNSMVLHISSTLVLHSTSTISFHAHTSCLYLNTMQLPSWSCL
jgi:hypothetical protein